jgi:hypothetical protein
MSDENIGVTDNAVAAPEITDDFKGLLVESNGEKLEKSTQSEPVEEPPIENEGEPKLEVEQKPKRPGKVERQLAREQAEKAELLARLEKLEKQQTVNKSDKPDVDAPPNPNDFEDVLDFIAADRQYAIDQALKNERQARTREQTEVQKSQDIQKKAESLKEREAKIVEENPTYYEDIDDLVSEGLITQPIIEAVLDSPIGEKIGLHLTKNPDDAAVLAQLTGPAFYRAIGILEAHLAGNKEENTVQRQTKATAPISQVRTSAVSDGDPSKMSQREFDKWMKV